MKYQVLLTVLVIGAVGFHSNAKAFQDTYQSESQIEPEVGGQLPLSLPETTYEYGNDIIDVEHCPPMETVRDKNLELLEYSGRVEVGSRPGPEMCYYPLPALLVRKEYTCAGHIQFAHSNGVKFFNNMVPGESPADAIEKSDVLELIKEGCANKPKSGGVVIGQCRETVITYVNDKEVSRNEGAYDPGTKEAFECKYQQ
jgi:hypothetical protein